MRKSSLFALFTILFLLSGCSDPTNIEEDFTDTPGVSETSETSDTYIEDSNNEESTSPYTKEELENDPLAPSTDPRDYNENGEFVPHDGPSDDPADYNSNGEYKPVEEMTPEEIQEELEQMLEDSLNNNQ
ncbi:hypothetical protein [Parageobacillus sp. G301]|uniref:hypothetical protein n=1 Tax=Parageobacillus sp. G301 TaxID=2998290 RepID=UPI002495DB52|nr:hypothetical protein [Parageobacillus sp. G301]GLH62400.1 hypothetical protein PG301_02400 [Parageobacillus sp. G301]